MISESEVYSSARVMIEQHGPNARHKAALHAEKLRQRGDRLGCRTWKMIAQAIQDIQNAPEETEDKAS